MRYRLLILLLLGVCCLGMGKKKVAIPIRFYTETAEGDTDTFSAPVTLLNGKRTYIDQVAAISERDIIAVYPFTAADGSGGLALKLDFHGTASLDSVSVAKRGSFLIATVDSRQLADLAIDKRISDGVVTIPSGITTAEMRTILKTYPIIGGGGKKKLKKKDVFSVGL